jgi:NADPH:quinone reductase-like Zn-dependent oxidoreductase
MAWAAPSFSVACLRASIGYGDAADSALPEDDAHQIKVRSLAPSRAFERMNAFFNKHEIHPVIDKVYSFEQAREAYEHLGRGAFGKVVIRVTA